MDILFIGNFLSKTRGTILPSEKLAGLINSKEIRISTSSSFESKVLRLLDILSSSLLRPYQKAHVDVFSGPAFTFAALSSKLIKWRGKTLILNLHGGALPEYYLANEAKVRSVLELADEIFTPSKYLLEFFSEKGFKIRYLPNFVQLKHFPYKKREALSPPYKLLWVRGLTQIYNPKVPIELVKILASEYPGIRLIMIGPDKGMMEECRQLVEEYGLEDQIELTGKLPNEVLKDYYQDCDIFLNTTSFESFGICVVEAASCGIPVVSSSVGELPMLWEDEQDILFVDDIEAEEYARKIRQLFDSPALYTQLSENAYKKARQFRWEVIREQWIDLLQAK